MKTIWVTLNVAGWHDQWMRDSASRLYATEYLAEQIGELANVQAECHPMVTPAGRKLLGERTLLMLRIRRGNTEQAVEEAAALVRTVADEIGLRVLNIHALADIRQLAS